MEESIVITVDLEVASHREFPEDGTVEVHGYVGDYEVMVVIPLAKWQSRLRHLEKHKKLQARRTQ